MKIEAGSLWHWHAVGDGEYLGLITDVKDGRIYVEWLWCAKSNFGPRVGQKETYLLSNVLNWISKRDCSIL